MYNHIKRDALIQFIEGDKQPDEERKNNLITKEEITNLESHNIHLNVSISSGCENGIYVNNKDSAHWLDRQLRSHIEFSLVDEKLAMKILKWLEDSSFIFTMFNSKDGETITNVSKEEKSFNLIRERINKDKKLLSTSEWKNIKNITRKIDNPGSVYCFIISAQEYCTGNVEKDLLDYLNR